MSFLSVLATRTTREGACQQVPRGQFTGKADVCRRSATQAPEQGNLRPTARAVGAQVSRAKSACGSDLAARRLATLMSLRDGHGDGFVAVTVQILLAPTGCEGVGLDLFRVGGNVGSRRSGTGLSSPTTSGRWKRRKSRPDPHAWPPCPNRPRIAHLHTIPTLGNMWRAAPCNFPKGLGLGFRPRFGVGWRMRSQLLIAPRFVRLPAVVLGCALLFCRESGRVSWRWRAGRCFAGCRAGCGDRSCCAVRRGGSSDR